MRGWDPGKEKRGILWFLLRMNDVFMGWGL
jgi:hypothetical protein